MGSRATRDRALRSPAEAGGVALAVLDRLGEHCYLAADRGGGGVTTLLFLDAPQVDGERSSRGLERIRRRLQLDERISDRCFDDLRIKDDLLELAAEHAEITERIQRARGTVRRN